MKDRERRSGRKKSLCYWDVSSAKALKGLTGIDGGMLHERECLPLAAENCIAALESLQGGLERDSPAVQKLVYALHTGNMHRKQTWYLS